MKNLQTSIVVEETWVEKQTEKLQSMPTATSARELDVSTFLNLFLLEFLFSYRNLFYLKFFYREIFTENLRIFSRNSSCCYFWGLCERVKDWMNVINVKWILMGEIWTPYMYFRLNRIIQNGVTQFSACIQRKYMKNIISRF